MSGNIHSVSMLILMQHDLEKAVEFYKKLGLTLRFCVKGQWAEFDINGVKIGLCAVSDELPERPTGMVFNVSDLKSFYDNQKSVLSFISEPVERAHGIMVGLRDPGNNIIDFYEPTPETLREAVKKAHEQNNDNAAACSNQKEGCCRDQKFATNETEVSG